MSNDTSDLILLDSLLLKLISLTDSNDIQLQIDNIIYKILYYLIDRSESIRLKVIEILNVIVSLLKADGAISINYKILVDSYYEQSKSSSSIYYDNFVLLFIEIGINRLNNVEDKDILYLVYNISKKSNIVQKKIFSIYLLMIEKHQCVSLDLNTNDLNILLPLIINYLLTSNDTQATTKLSLLKSLCFDHTYNLLPYIIASCDTHHTVVDFSLSALKLLKIDLETNSIEQLLNMCLNKTASDNIRIKCMEYLNKSKKAANSFPLTVKILFEFLFSNPKLRNVGCLYLLHVCTNATGPQFPEAIGKLLLTPIGKIINESNDSQMFTSFGCLFDRFPQLITLDNTKLFFEAWKKKATDDVTTGLSYLMSAYKKRSKLKNNNEGELKNFLLSMVNEGVLALKWLNTLFPFSDCSIRIACLHHTGSIWPHDIREEANRGLKPLHSLLIEPGDEDKHAIQLVGLFPYWAEFIQSASVQINLESKPLPTSDLAELINLLKFTQRAFDRLVFDQAYSNSTTEAALVFNFSNTFQDILKNDKNFLSYYSTPIDTWIKLLKYSLNADVNMTNAPSLHVIASELLSQLLHCLPQEYYALHPLSSDLSWITSKLLSCSSDASVELAKIYGLALKTVSEADLIKESDSLKIQMKKKSKLQVAAILAYGFVLSYLPPFYENVSTIYEFTKLSHDLDVVASALRSLSIIAKSCILPFSDLYNINDFIKHLMILTTKKEERVNELSIEVIGSMCISDRSTEFLNLAMDSLFSISTSKDEEIQFVVADSLVQLCIGHSTYTNDVIINNSYISNYFLKVFVFFSGSSIQKQSATIYILSLINKMGLHPEIVASRERLQNFLIDALGDSKQITQEAAAKALAILAQQVDPASKDILVAALMKQFSGNTARVTGDTIVEGSNSGSTYSELCSVAQDMGQPSLAYAFFDLASTSAVWNSKRGVAFALGSMKQVLPSLKNCIPKLYRYLHDPNKKIKSTMESLWKELVPDSTNTVNQYFDLILSECLTTMTVREIRVREASVSAVTALLSGRTYSEVGKFVSEIWTKTLRAVDDGASQDNVRKAAIPLSTSVINLSVRLCDPVFTSEKDASQSLKEILPILIHKGVLDRASEIRTISIACLLKIIKVSKKLLKPYVAELLSCLLEGLTTLEPNMLAYLQLHTDKINLTPEQLESLRLSAQRSSPLNEAINLCLNQVSDENMEAVIGALATTLKGGIGLPTLTGTTKAIIALIGSRLPDEIRPFAKTILNSLSSNLLNESSNTIKKLYCTCISYVVKVAKQAQVNSTIELLKKLCTGEASARATGAVLALELSKICLDSIKPYFQDILPLIFFGLNSLEADVAKNFNEAWDECVPGHTNGLKLYLNELYSFSSKYLSNEDWAFKRMSLKSLNSIITGIGNEDTFIGTGTQLSRQLTSMLPGRLWDGKEEIFETLSLLCEKCKSLPLVDYENICKSVLIEAQRPKKEYKRKAIECLSRLVSSNETIDSKIGFLKQLRPLFESLITISNSSLVSQNLTEAEQEEATKLKKLDDTLLMSAIESLGKIWNASCAESKSLEYGWCLTLMNNAIDGVSWKTRLSSIKIISTMLINKDHSAPFVLSSLELTKLLQNLDTSIIDLKYSEIREASITVLTAMYHHIKANNSSLEFIETIKSLVSNRLISDPDAKIKVQLNVLKELIQK